MAQGSEKQEGAEVPQPTGTGKSLPLAPPDDDSKDFSGDVMPSPTTVEAPPYNPEKQKDFTRGRITYWLLFLVSGIVLFVLIGWCISISLGSDASKFLGDTKDIAATYFNPLLALLGPVVGFYFGQRDNSGRAPPKGT